MAMSQAVSNVTQNHLKTLDHDVMEKVILENDLAKLTPTEKVRYVSQVCQTLGLNPATRPFQLLKFNNKEVLYATKDATEQLRYLRGVSIKSLDTKILQDSLYVVTANATLPDGRTDSSTGVTVINGLKGEPLANAMMKAETKAKRRATLSICGLGFLDESEVDSIPNASKISIDEVVVNNVVDTKTATVEIMETRNIDEDLQNVSWANDIDELQEIFKPAYKYYLSTKNKTALKKLIDAKDKRKKEIETYTANAAVSENVNAETGEVTE